MISSSMRKNRRGNKKVGARVPTSDHCPLISAIDITARKQLEWHGFQILQEINHLVSPKLLPFLRTRTAKNRCLRTHITRLSPLASNLFFPCARTPTLITAIYLAKSIPENGTLT